MKIERLLGTVAIACSIAWAQPPERGRALKPIAPLEQPDAQRTKEELARLLEHYPPSLPAVLALDPSLLSNESFLEPYPSLAGFLNIHPEICVVHPRLSAAQYRFRTYVYRLSRGDLRLRSMPDSGGQKPPRRMPSCCDGPAAHEIMMKPMEYAHLRDTRFYSRVGRPIANRPPDPIRPHVFRQARCPLAQGFNGAPPTAYCRSNGSTRATSRPQPAPAHQPVPRAAAYSDR
jgi:hypothetical protein